MNEINKFFYNDKYYLLGFNKFYEKIKQKNINISKTELNFTMIKKYHKDLNQKIKN